MIGKLLRNRSNLIHPSCRRNLPRRRVQMELQSPLGQWVPYMTTVEKQRGAPTDAPQQYRNQTAHILADSISTANGYCEIARTPLEHGKAFEMLSRVRPDCSYAGLAWTCICARRAGLAWFDFERWLNRCGRTDNIPSLRRTWYLAGFVGDAAFTALALERAGGAA